MSKDVECKHGRRVIRRGVPNVTTGPSSGSSTPAQPLNGTGVVVRQIVTPSRSTGEYEFQGYTDRGQALYEMEGSNGYRIAKCNNPTQEVLAALSIDRGTGLADVYAALCGVSPWDPDYVSAPLCDLIGMAISVGWSWDSILEEIEDEMQRLRGKDWKSPPTV